MFLFGNNGHIKYMYYNISLSKGLPIARISGGQFHGHTIKIYKSDYKEPNNQEFYLGDQDKGLVEPLYHTQLDDDPNRYLISGMSGSGKSYFGRDIAIDYLERNPKCKVVLISGIPREDDRIFYCGNDKKGNKSGCGKIIQSIIELESKEPSEKNSEKIERLEEKLKKCKVCGMIKKLKIDRTIVEDPIDISIFKDCLVIFDDLDRIVDPEIIQELEAIRDKIIQSGRTSNIAVMTINQNLLQGRKTGTPNKGSLNIIMFPKSTTKYQIVEFLMRYMFMPKTIINKIMNLPSRWVSINIACPNFVLHQKGIYLL